MVLTSGPVVHYGLNATDKIDLKHKGAWGYGGTGGAPGGIFFSIATEADSTIKVDEEDDDYENNPFISPLFMYCMADPEDPKGMVCMLKANKVLNDILEIGIFDEEGYGYIEDENNYDIFYKGLDLLFNMKKMKPYEKDKVIEDLTTGYYGGETLIPSFLSGSVDVLFEAEPETKKFLRPKVRKWVEEENVNKLCSYILRGYGFDPILIVGGEIIVYDMSIIRQVGEPYRLKDVSKIFNY